MSAAPDPSHHDSTHASAAATGAAAPSRLAAALQARIASGKPLDAGDVLRLAIVLHEAHRHEEAARWCRTGLRFGCEDWRLLNVLGVALKALGRLDEAQAELERGLRVAPSEAALLSNLGNVLLAQGKAERAGEVFSTLAGRNPGDAHARRMQGLAARRAGRMDEALAHAEAARALTPLDASAWIDLAALFEETGRRAEAFAVIDRAIALIGPARPLVDTRIKLLRRDGRYEDAKAY
ncbi:tetratricopeptide repeat protein, partial [Nostoc sp. NIES-2111]